MRGAKVMVVGALTLTGLARVPAKVPRPALKKVRLAPLREIAPEPRPEPLALIELRMTLPALRVTGPPKALALLIVSEPLPDLRRAVVPPIAPVPPRT